MNIEYIDGKYVYINPKSGLKFYDLIVDFRNKEQEKSYRIITNIEKINSTNKKCSMIILTMFYSAPYCKHDLDNIGSICRYITTEELIIREFATIPDQVTDIQDVNSIDKLLCPPGFSEIKPSVINNLIPSYYTKYWDMV